LDVVGSEAFGSFLGPELAPGLPEFNLQIGEVLISEQTSTFSALVLIATAAIGLGFVRRRSA
jgi:hypothetical protein